MATAAPEDVQRLGYDLNRLPPEIKPHRNARDMMQGGEDCFVIDLFGYSAEEARTRHPALYQWLFDRVKPERDHNKDAQFRRDWWLFGRSNRDLRKSWGGLERIILTPETSKHRVFAFQPLPFCPDHKLYAICCEDAWILGVPAPRINDVVRERRCVTADTALRLARYLGTSAEFWMGLQADYDLRIAENAVSEALGRIRRMERATA